MIIRLVFIFLCCVPVIGVGILDAGQRTKSGQVTTLNQFVSASRIKKIRIDGAFPIFSNEIQNVMTIVVGDVFKKDKLDEQAARIISLLKREGFVDPKVYVSSQMDDEDGHHVVSVQIDKGPSIRISGVKITGNKHIADLRLKLKTKAYRPWAFFSGGHRLVEKQLDKDKKQLLQVYREKGFADVQIEYDVNRDESENQVSIVFNVIEGPLYVFDFVGNSSIKTSALKKQIVVFKEGNSHGFGVRKSIRNMKALYTRQGYPDARISTQIKDVKNEETIQRKVSFGVDEGAQYLVESLIFKGNHAFDEKQIVRQTLTGNPGIGRARVYVKKVLEQDLDAIRAFYLEQGYAKAQVEKAVEISEVQEQDQRNIKQVRIDIRIDEGPQTRVGTIMFEGLAGLDASAALELISLKPESVFRQYMVESDENILKAIISEKGYPHVQVTTRVNLHPDEKEADLTFQVVSGPMVTLNQIAYAGNFRTSASVLEDEMVVKSSQPLSLTGLLKSRRNMLDMDALDSARFRTLGLSEQSPTVDLVVEVKEKKPYYMELEAGYDTRRHIYAVAALGDHNFLGHNLNLESALEISQVGYNAYTSLKEPNLLGTKILTSSRVFIEKKEEFNKAFGTKAFGLSQEAFIHFFNKKLTASTGISYRSHEQYITYGSILSAQDTETYERRDIFVFSKALTWRNTDSYVRPTKGMLSSAAIDISQGIDNDLDDFIKYQLDSRWYLTPMERLTLAAHGRYGYIQPYGDNTRIPEDQLFFLGGTSTVRGFKENLLRYDAEHNAVGGKQVLHGSLEARIDLSYNFECAVFFDVGSVSQAFDPYGSDDFRSSVGFGLRYMTPIGPVGLLYGYKLDPRPEESRGAVHFSMGYTF